MKKIILKIIFIFLIFSVVLLNIPQSKSTIEVRTRYENFNYFNNNINNKNNYSFWGTNFKYSFVNNFNNNKFGLTLLTPYLINLPSNSTSSVGPLGLGAIYYQFSNPNNIAFIIKEFYLDLSLYKDKNESINFKIGRFDFNDGTYALPKNETLKWIRLNKIQQRMIGTFGFSHIQRSFEGFNLSFDKQDVTNTKNITIFYGRPTYGVFDIKTPNEPINNLSIGHIAYTIFNDASDFRLFYTYYNDHRELLKTSNNAIPIRDSVTINSIGFNYSKIFENPNNIFSFVGYYNYQFGTYGKLKHNANAYLIDIGYKIKNNLEPHFRIGYFRSTGDNNSQDNKHNTYFSFIYTPRLYALFPFYNQMNISDFYISLYLKLSSKANMFLQYNDLNLSSKWDRWYAGGGAFNEQVFGYTAVNSKNFSKLATLYNITFNYKLNNNSNITLYYGYANGKDVIKQNFPLKSNASYFFIEYNLKLDF
jgi:hypothetical protein